MTECYECSRLAELLAENTQLRHLVGKQVYHDDFYDCESTVSVDELAKLQAELKAARQAHAQAEYEAATLREQLEQIRRVVA